MLLLISVYIGFIGLFVGSFLNVLIDRLPRGKSVLFDRSECDFCHKKLQWYELIPVISFVIQKGRCRSCKKGLSFQYPLSEIATALVFFFVSLYTLPNILLLISSLIIASCLLVITVIDIKHFLIPDSLLIIATLVQFMYLVYAFPEHLVTRIIAGICSLLFLGSIWFFTKGKGMGFGDVKFAFFLGLSLGFPAIVVGYYVAFLTGAFLGIILIVAGKKSAKTKVPFGPFLIWGYCIALLYSEYIIQLFGF